MTPADGSDFPHAGGRGARPAGRRRRSCCTAAGRSCCSRASRPRRPLSGHLIQAGSTVALDGRMLARSRAGGGVRWHGVAVLDAVPAAGDELRGAACGGRWRLRRPAAPRHRARAAGRARPPRRRQLPRRLRLPARAPARRAPGRHAPRRGRTAPSPAASSPPPPSATASSRSSPRPTPAGSSRRAGRCRCRPAPPSSPTPPTTWRCARSRWRISSATTSCRPAAASPLRQVLARADAAAVDAVFFEEGGRLLRLDVVPGSVLLTASAPRRMSRRCCRASRRPDGDARAR